MAIKQSGRRKARVSTPTTQRVQRLRERLASESDPLRRKMIEAQLVALEPSDGGWQGKRAASG